MWLLLCRLIWQIGESSWPIWPDKNQMDSIGLHWRTRDQIGQRGKTVQSWPSAKVTIRCHQTEFPKHKILLEVKRPNREIVLCPPKWRNATSPVTAILLYFWCKCKLRARRSLWRCLCSLVQFLFTIFLVLTQPVTTCTFWCKAGWWQRWTFLGRAESSSQSVTVRRCGRGTLAWSSPPVQASRLANQAH